MNFSQSLYCNNDSYIVTPSSKYHCSGLLIDQEAFPNHEYCCYWKFTDKSKADSEVNTCISITDEQYNDLPAYISLLESKYENLIIDCQIPQRLYCNNPLIDEEIDNNTNNYFCSSRYIEDNNSEDSHCCKWKYKDSNNGNSEVEKCLSINEDLFNKVVKFVEEKNEDINSGFSELSIDCHSGYLTKANLLLLLAFLLI